MDKYSFYVEKNFYKSLVKSNKKNFCWKDNSFQMKEIFIE